MATFRLLSYSKAGRATGAVAIGSLAYDLADVRPTTPTVLAVMEDWAAASADLRALCPDGVHTTPALLALLQDCRDAARTTSDSLNTLFFAHSGESSQSVGA